VGKAMPASRPFSSMSARTEFSSVSHSSTMGMPGFAIVRIYFRTCDARETGMHESKGSPAQLHHWDDLLWVSFRTRGGVNSVTQETIRAPRAVHQRVELARGTLWAKPP